MLIKSNNDVKNGCNIPDEINSTKMIPVTLLLNTVVIAITRLNKAKLITNMTAEDLSITPIDSITNPSIRIFPKIKPIP